MKPHTNTRRLLHVFNRYSEDQRGYIAIVTAIATIPLMGLIGAAVDYGLALRLKTALQAATDATNLMLCQSGSSTPLSTLKVQAVTAMTSYMGTSVNLVVDDPVVTSNPRTIQLTTHATSKTHFSRFVGGANIPVIGAAKCATPVPKTYEIALVLDTTGSMANSSGNGSKLAAMQTAATNFVDYVKGSSAFASDTRISIVPFAASVNVGPSYANASWVDTTGSSSFHWTNIDKKEAKKVGFVSRLSIFALLAAIYPSWGWAGCFETLPYPNNVQDGSPTSVDTLFIPMFAPDEPGDGRTGTATFTAGSKNYYSFNSYIDDSTNVPTCKANPSSFIAAESSACKYISAQGASYTSSNAVGLPNGPNFMCTSKPLQRLTTDASSLKSLISSLVASGATNIHEGFMWGWRTLSPISVFRDGASYSSATTAKVIVLMTDGENSWADNPYNNLNQTIYFPMGYFLNADDSNPDSRLPVANRGLSSTVGARNALDQLTLEACTNAKASSISVYTIGFSTSSDPIDSQGTTLLRNCASSSSQAYIANDSASLIAAFSQIASGIGKIRLTQ